MTHLIELIYTEEKIGKGTEEDPSRLLRQLFTKDGEPVASEDMHKNDSWFKARSITN